MDADPSRRPTPREGLAGRVVTGGLWVTAARLTGRVLSFIRVLVLARVLTPHDFGVVAAGALAVAFLETLSASGTAALLIHRGERTRALYDTAWTLGLIRRGVGSAILWIASPTIAGFFGSPEAAPIVRVLAFMPVLQALRNIGALEFTRDLRLGQDYLLEVGGSLVDAIVAIALAFWLRNAWALAIAMVAGEAFSTALTYVRHPYRPAIRLDWREVRGLLQWGRWSVGARLMGWALQHGVHTVVGRWLGPTPLGVYQMATRGALLPTAALGPAAAKVALAAFSKLRGEPERMRAAYARVLATVALVTFPASALLATYADGLVRALLGPQWLALGPVLRILAVQGLCRSVAGTTSPLFQGLGRPGLQALTIAVELAVTAIAIGPLLAGAGLIGVAGAAAVAAGVQATVALVLAMRVAALGGREIWRALGPPGLACVPVLVLRSALPASPDAVPGLVGAIAVSLAVYALGILGLTRAGAYAVDPEIAARLRGLRLPRWGSRE